MGKNLFKMILMSIVILGFSSPAYAIDQYVHGDFASNTSSCGRCHVTHAAGSENLIIDSYDRTRMCLSCHGYMSIMSQYDVYQGNTRGTDWVTRPSPAGGFVQSADPESDWTTDVSATSNVNTSSHHVQSYADPGYLPPGQTNGDVPGGTMNFTGDLTCCSCHDPHAGGKYPAAAGDTYRNPRLLKKRPVDTGVDHVVYMKIDYDYGSGPAWDPIPEGGTGHTSQVMEYGKGFNEWCGSCHDLFNTESVVGTDDPNRTGSYGIDNGSGQQTYRHKMGVLLTKTDVTSATGLASVVQNGLPLPTDTNGDRDGVSTSTNRLACISCHRAHGSSVKVSTGYTRFNSYTTYYVDGDGAPVSVATIGAADDGASALLRLKERDVCFKCHGAAEYNTFAGNGNYGKGN